MNAAFRKNHREFAAIRQGEKGPSSVYRVTLDANGRPVRKELAPETFRRKQADAWQREEAVEARRKLGLSQTEFARLMGISVRTLHYWEQCGRGSRALETSRLESPRRAKIHRCLNLRP